MSRIDFNSFLKERDRAAQAYSTGDGAPVVAMTATAGTVSFFDPKGGTELGPARVAQVFAEGAAHFGPGGTSRLEVLDSGADGDLGWWTGLQHAELAIKGAAGLQRMTIRITEVFRREGDAWRLCHRHASMAQ